MRNAKAVGIALGKLNHRVDKAAFEEDYAARERGGGGEVQKKGVAAQNGEHLFSLLASRFLSQPSSFRLCKCQNGGVRHSFALHH